MQAYKKHHPPPPLTPALTPTRPWPPDAGGWVILVLLLAALCGPALHDLWAVWQSDPSLSQSPLILLLAVGHLWQCRARLQMRRSASGAGFACLALSALMYVAAVWADIDFLKPLALIGVGAGIIWFLGGAAAAGAAAGALGLLVFTVPWPTTVTERLAFPMQMLSSSYAAQLAGMLGLPVVRDGVNIAVMPHPGAPPVYAITVAQACSGLTSMTVLLTLGYLVAYHTPTKLGWRVLLAASVVPLALLLNAVRLALVLAAGAHHSHAFAQWVHDHEEPVLVLLCSLALVAIRQALLAWQDGHREDSTADAGPSRGAVPSREGVLARGTGGGGSVLEDHTGLVPTRGTQNPEMQPEACTGGTGRGDAFGRRSGGLPPGVMLSRPRTASGSTPVGEAAAKSGPGGEPGQDDPHGWDMPHV